MGHYLNIELTNADRIKKPYNAVFDLSNNVAELFRTHLVRDFEIELLKGVEDTTSKPGRTLFKFNIGPDKEHILQDYIKALNEVAYPLGNRDN